MQNKHVSPISAFRIEETCLFCSSTPRTGSELARRRRFARSLLGRGWCLLGWHQVGWLLVLIGGRSLCSGMAGELFLLRLIGLESLRAGWFLDWGVGILA